CCLKKNLLSNSSLKEQYGLQCWLVSYQSTPQAVAFTKLSNQTLRQRNIELLLMHCWIALERNHAAQVRLNLLQHVALGPAQGFGHVGMNAQDHFVGVVPLFRDTARFGQDFVADGLRTLD